MRSHCLAFSSAHSNALITDLFLRGGYGNLPGVFLAEDGRWELWFPQDAMEALAERGEARLRADGFWDGYAAAAARGMAAMAGLDRYKPLLSVATLADYRGLLAAAAATIADFMALYSQTEYFHFRRLDRALADWARAQAGAGAAALVTDVLMGRDTVSLPPGVEVAARLVRAASDLRFRMREALNHAFFGDGIFMALMVAFERLTEREDFPYLNCDELQAVLRGEAVPPMDARGEALAVHRTGERWVFDHGPAALDIARAVRSSAAGGAELHGMAASGGCAAGVVCRFALGEPPRPGRMLPGAILVAPTTGPEFTAIVQMAGGIVTDEGGLMSHAALLARELRIPCVVDTAVATRTLRDGDWVTVDAVQGVVRRA